MLAVVYDDTRTPFSPPFYHCNKELHKLRVTLVGISNKTQAFDAPFTSNALSFKHFLLKVCDDIIWVLHMVNCHC